MSFGKKKSKGSQTQTQTTTLNPWSQGQFDTQSKGMFDALANYNQNSPFKAYTGQMVAGMSGGQQDARALAGQPGFDPATDTSKYYNPFEQEVVGAAGNYFDEQLQGAISNNQARATQAGAYGGSRHGVADAELMRTSGMDKANMMAGLRYQGFNDARDTGFRADENRRMNVGMLEQLGANEREIQQATLLAQRAEFDREAKDQLDRLMMDLQIRQGIMSGTPMLTDTKGTGQYSGSESSAGFAPKFSFGPLSFGA